MGMKDDGRVDARQSSPGQNTRTVDVDQVASAR